MSEVTRSDINHLSNKIDSLSYVTRQIESTVERMDASLAGLETSVDAVKSDLEQLASDFNKMLLEQRRTASYQRALTELVRVRQEIEQKYGNYKIVRETMLGVLQATDLALVKKTTISRISEEIMLSTPEYWLAPCLVAIAAWIGNDRDLAERAIREAVKRNEEKTALTMALVCRRNNRTQTCYQWLSIYFSKQSAANFSESTFAYVDAYVNGIFGPDENRMCEDYITKWMNEVKQNNSAFEAEQEAMWKSYCEKFRSSAEEDYPVMSELVTEFPEINNYISRVKSVPGIKNKFGKMVAAKVDGEELKEKIDSRLIALIRQYDKAEEDIRREEAFLQKIKDFKGDEEQAAAFMRAQDQARQERALNMVEQMTKVIQSDDAHHSEQKTAMTMLSGYVRKGYNSYIKEDRAEFPENITLNLNGWKTRLGDDNDITHKQSDYEVYMNQNLQLELGKINKERPNMFKMAAMGAGALGLVMLIFMPLLGVLLLGGGAALFYLKMQEEKKNAALETQLQEQYSTNIQEGKINIARAHNEWKEAKQLVIDFDKTAQDFLG